MTNKILVFDCGDTLLRLVPDKVTTCHGVLHARGIGVSKERIADAYRIAEAVLPRRSSLEGTRQAQTAFYQTFNRNLCVQLGLESRWAELDPVLQKAFGTKPHWVPYPEVVSVLTTLTETATMHVLANWDQQLEIRLAEAGLTSFFRSIHASAVLGAEKPDPVIFARFLALHDYRGEQCIYIGNDYGADVVGSRNAGLLPVLVDREKRYDHADCPVLSSLKELPEWLARIEM